MKFEKALNETGTKSPTSISKIYPKIAVKSIKPHKSKLKKIGTIKKSKSKFIKKKSYLPSKYSFSGGKLRKGSRKGTAQKFKW